MRKVIFGGSFNPPGIHHRKVVELVLDTNLFEEVIIIPCGDRADKKYVEPAHRKHLVQLAFQNMHRVRVECFNLDENTFTSNYDLEEMYKSEGELWHLVGGDLVVCDEQNRCVVQRRWKEGEYIWEHFNFLIIDRPGFYPNVKQLPPKSLVLNASVRGSSSEIRKAVETQEDILTMTDSAVADYIRSRNLYK